MKETVHEGVGPEKSSVVSLARGLSVKRESSVFRCEKINSKKLLVVVVALVVATVVAAVTAVVCRLKWEVRWSRISR